MDEEWRGSQAASRCPFQNPDADLSTILSHNALFCDRCRDEEILEKTKGEEILFANGPPYWMLPSGNTTVGKQEDQQKGDESKQKRSLPLLEFFSQIQKTRKTDDAEPIAPTKESLAEQESTSVHDIPMYSGKKGSGARKQPKKGRLDSMEPGTSATSGVVLSAKPEPTKKKSQQRVPTGIALHKLAKQGFSKEEALQKYVEKQRERAAPKIDDDKVQIDREDMPWAPSFPKALRKRRSIIQKPVDHQRYVAIVANFLNANHPQPRFQQNRLEVRVMDEKLEDERMQYQQVVLQSLCSRKKSIYTCENQRAVSYILDRLRARASSLQCHYGQPIYEDEMKDLAVDALTVLTKKAVLHRGKIPKIVLPNERRRFLFNQFVEDISAQYPSTETGKYPLEFDELATHLAVKYSVRVVMCSSSALKILCNPWVADSSTYLIPVVVKRCFSERTNRFENVCLVGKACVEGTVNGPSLWRRYLKFAVKLALYGETKKETSEKISTKTGGRQRGMLHAMIEQTGVDPEEKEAAKTKLSIVNDEEPAFVIADNDDVSEKTSSDTINHKDVESSSTIPARTCDDILGDIMNEMGSSDSDFTKYYKGAEHGQVLSSFAGADLNKRYTLFSLGHDGVQDVDVIIRSNNDGVDTTGSELAVVHKVEYAAEFGAERLDDEEWLHDYFCCKLKCASQLLRFRIHNAEQHLLQKERYNENMLSTNRPDLRKLAEERTQWLKRVVVKLEALQPGNYLIRKEANRWQILPPAEDINSAFLKEEQIKGVCFDDRLPPIKDVFRGIDEHLVLVYHIVQKRIPASFGPNKDVNQRNSGKERNNNIVQRSAQPSQSQQSADGVFDSPAPEDASFNQGMQKQQQSKRRGKKRSRNRSRGNFAGGSRTSQDAKRPRFVDFDAPQASQML